MAYFIGALARVVCSAVVYSTLATTCGWLAGALCCGLRSESVLAAGNGREGGRSRFGVAVIPLRASRRG